MAPALAIPQRLVVAIAAMVMMLVVVYLPIIDTMEVAVIAAVISKI